MALIHWSWMIDRLDRAKIYIYSLAGNAHRLALKRLSSDQTQI